MPRAYSYIRFSSKKQHWKGESFRRQFEFAVEVCRENGWVLDDSLTLSHLGVSAFRGNNAKVGALGEFSYDRLTTLHAGDFVYPKLMAWEGALAVVPENCDGLVVSTEFPVFEINTARVLPEVLDVYLRDPDVWPHLFSKSTGTNVRRQRLNPSDFLKYQFPLPPRHVQERLRSVVGALSTLAPAQAETAADLDALLPSVLNRAFAGNL